MLEIAGLTKRFAEVLALDGATFSVKKGEVFGFLGANGAGKTTTMRIILGLLKADEGTVTWDGKPAADLPRKTWGYMPEERGLYLRMPVLEQLVFFASLYGVPRRKATDDAKHWLARFRISDYADRKARHCPRATSRRCSTSRPCCTIPMCC
jgi:ABC-2 type transport system ATP-binding protein